MGNFLPWTFVGRGKRHGTTDAGLTGKKQRRCGNQAAPAKIFGDGKPTVQRRGDFAAGKRADALRDQPRRQDRCRAHSSCAGTRLMAGWPGRSTALAISVAAASASAPVRASTVTASAMPSEKERPRQPLVAMPRTPSSARMVMRSARPCAGAGDGKGHRLARAEMERAVAAIVDIGAVELAAGKQRGEHFVGYRSGDGGHRRDEAFRQRHDGRFHAPRRRAGEGARRQKQPGGAVREAPRPTRSGSSGSARPPARRRHGIRPPRQRPRRSGRSAHG